MPTRRSLLCSSGSLLAGVSLVGCISNSPSTGESPSEATTEGSTKSDVSTGKSSEPITSPTTSEPVPTAGDLTTTTRDSVKGALETDRMVGDNTVTTTTDTCLDTVQFKELSKDAQMEFKTARDEGGLVKPHSQFQIVEELKFVDDQIGGETCIQVEGDRYYAVYGGSHVQNEYELKIVPVGTEFVGFDRDYNDEEKSNQSSTPTAQK